MDEKINLSKLDKKATEDLLKIGDMVIFHLEPKSKNDWEADDEEWKQLQSHDGQYALVTSVNVQYETGSEPQYVTISFEDGYEIEAVDAKILELTNFSKDKSKEKIVSLNKKATGEPDQEYDHEFFDALVKQLAEAGFTGAKHREFDKYQGVYLRVPRVDTFWVKSVYYTGQKTEETKNSNTFQYVKGTEEEHYVLYPESDDVAEIHVSNKDGLVSAADLISYCIQVTSNKKASLNKRADEWDSFYKWYSEKNNISLNEAYDKISSMSNDEVKSKFDEFKATKTEKVASETADEYHKYYMIEQYQNELDAINHQLEGGRSKTTIQVDKLLERKKELEEILKHASLVKKAVYVKKTDSKGRSLVYYEEGGHNLYQLYIEDKDGKDLWSSNDFEEINSLFEDSFVDFKKPDESILFLLGETKMAAKKESSLEQPLWKMGDVITYDDGIHLVLNVGEHYYNLGNLTIKPYGDSDVDIAEVDSNSRKIELYMLPAAAKKGLEAFEIYKGRIWEKASLETKSDKQALCHLCNKVVEFESQLHEKCPGNTNPNGNHQVSIMDLRYIKKGASLNKIAIRVVPMSDGIFEIGIFGAADEIKVAATTLKELYSDVRADSQSILLRVGARSAKEAKEKVKEVLKGRTTLAVESALNKSAHTFTCPKCKSTETISNVYDEKICMKCGGVKMEKTADDTFSNVAHEWDKWMDHFDGDQARATRETARVLDTTVAEVKRVLKLSSLKKKAKSAELVNYESWVKEKGHLVPNASSVLREYIKEKNLNNSNYEQLAKEMGFTDLRYSSLNRSAEEPKVRPTEYKEHKIRPREVSEESVRSADLPTEAIMDAYKKLKTHQNNLAELKRMADTLKAKYEEEVRKIESEGKKVDDEAQVRQQVDNLVALISSSQSRVVSFGNKLVALVEEEKTIPYKVTDKEKVEKILDKFPEVEDYLKRLEASMKKYDTTEKIKKLIEFDVREHAVKPAPKAELTLSKLDKKAGLIDFLKDVYNAAKDLFSNLTELNEQLDLVLPEKEATASKKTSQQDHKCTEDKCTFYSTSKDFLILHLQTDHGYSEYDARQLVKTASKKCPKCDSELKVSNKSGPWGTFYECTEHGIISYPFIKTDSSLKKRAEDPMTEGEFYSIDEQIDTYKDEIKNKAEFSDVFQKELSILEKAKAAGYDLIDYAVISNQESIAWGKNSKTNKFKQLYYLNNDTDLVVDLHEKKDDPRFASLNKKSDYQNAHEAIKQLLDNPLYENARERRQLDKFVGMLLDVVPSDYIDVFSEDETEMYHAIDELISSSAKVKLAEFQDFTFTRYEYSGISIYSLDAMTFSYFVPLSLINELKTIPYAEEPYNVDELGISASLKKHSGTWSVPFTKSKATILNDFMVQLKNFEMPPRDVLYSIFGDDSLWDELDKIDRDSATHYLYFRAIKNHLQALLSDYRKYPETYKDKLNPDAEQILEYIAETMDMGKKASLEVSAKAGEWTVLPTGTRVKPSAPETNEFMTDHLKDAIFMVVEAEKWGANGQIFRKIVIGGFGNSPYGNVGDVVDLMHDQYPGRRIATATVIGYITGPDWAADKSKAVALMGDNSLPYYVFK